MQRLSVRFHLGGLSPEQVDPCIAHHMRLAGAESPDFSEKAIEAIATNTRWRSNNVPSRVLPEPGTFCFDGLDILQ